MNDQITIRGLKVPTLIGTLAHERLIQQTLEIDIQFPLDCKPSAMSDDLSLSVDYDALCSFVLEFGVGAQYQLLESFTEHLAQALLEHFPIDAVSLTVKKPLAVKQAQYIALSLERSRNDSC